FPALPRAPGGAFAGLELSFANSFALMEPAPCPRILPGTEQRPSDLPMLALRGGPEFPFKRRNRPSGHNGAIVFGDPSRAFGFAGGRAHPPRCAVRVPRHRLRLVFPDRAHAPPEAPV